jgi:hypothetical protein
MLHMIARRILFDPELAEKAVENCRTTASRNPPRFEHGGAFKSWLFKVLIDEALALPLENQQKGPKLLAQAINFEGSGFSNSL